MNDSPRARDGELLSAYLAGDLDDAEAAELEARIMRDRELAARLEATRAVIEGLARLDDVEPPSGFSERLQARLAAEREPTPTAADAAVAAPVSLADPRARRTQWLRDRWPALGMAAGVVGVVVLAAVAIGGLGTDDGLMPLAEPDAEEEARIEAFDEGVAEDAAPEEELAEEPLDRAGPDAPVLRDDAVALDDPENVRAHAAGAPAETLLGLPLEDAEDLEAAFTVAVQRAEPFANGVEPGTCVDAVAAGADQPVVPVQVESVVHQGRDALLYVTATAGADAEVINRIEAWVVDPEGCATRLYVELASDG